MEKRCAVEKEDYDLAKEKKQQMERYRGRAYARLQLHGLLDAALVGAQGPGWLTSAHLGPGLLWGEKGEPLPLPLSLCENEVPRGAHLLRG